MKRTLSILAVTFAMASFCFADINTAPWIAMQPDDTIVAPLVHSPYVKKTFGQRDIGHYAMPMMRRVFAIDHRKKIESAKLQVCGLGHFECYLDGTKVGDHFLDPGWSDYRHEAEFVEFDVTASIAPSDKKIKKKDATHVLGVMLGNGFYNIPRERYFKLLGSFGAPKLKLSLTVRYADGSVQEVVSDADWRTAASPIMFSSIYGGEDYDARKEQPGWNSDPKFDDSTWQPALAVTPAFDARLKPQKGTELVVLDTLTANNIRSQKVTEKDGTTRDAWIYDFGQNLSGIVELTLKNRVASGRTIRMRPAELLRSDGTLNQRVAQPYWFEFTANGSAQKWSPRFSYYGFRYVEMSGIHPDSIELRMLHTSARTCQSPIGSFRCSNDTLNRIHDLIDNAIRSNLASVPTDCPTREKLGWLEQDYLMLPSMMCRYNMKDIYVRLMQEIAIAQQPDGMVPTIAPYYTWFGWGFDDTPEWGSAFILAPWILYQYDGDDSLIRKYYQPMRRYVDYLHSRAREERDSLGQVTKPEHIIAYGLGDWYDLGPKGPGYSQLTPNGLTATATYFEDVRTMAQIAQLIGNKSDEQRFTALADSIRTAYRTQFDTCRSQTALAMGLSLGLMPDSARAKAQELLLADLAAPHITSDARGTQHWNTLLTAGDIGYVYLVRTLADMGQHALLMQLCTRPDIPGYAMQLAKGATSLTESWQALDNVSNNHLMLGHIMEWLYGYVGGIRKVDGRWIVEPADLPNVDWCECTLPTADGPVSVSWKRLPDGKIEVTRK